MKKCFGYQDNHTGHEPNAWSSLQLTNKTTYFVQPKRLLILPWAKKRQLSKTKRTKYGTKRLPGVYFGVRAYFIYSLQGTILTMIKTHHIHQKTTYSIILTIYGGPYWIGPTVHTKTYLVHLSLFLLPILSYLLWSPVISVFLVLITILPPYFDNNKRTSEQTNERHAILETVPKLSKHYYGGP